MNFLPNARKGNFMHVCGNMKHSGRACPSSKLSNAPLALWHDKSPVQAMATGHQEILGLPASRRSATTRSTTATTSRSAECSASLVAVPLLLPIPRKAGRQGSGGMPLVHDKAGTDPASAGTPVKAVKKKIFRKGTRGTPLTRNLRTAGMTP